MGKNLIIAFLLGVVTAQLCFGLKVPDIQTPDSVDPDLRDKIDYIVEILNTGKYVMGVSGATILSTDGLNSGEFMLDDSGVTKKLVVSNGTSNYYVELTSL